MQITNNYYLLENANNSSNINWTEVEAIATGISDFLILITLLATIIFARREIAAEKAKFDYEKNENRKRRKQQIYEISSTFLNNYMGREDTQSSIDEFTNSIETVRHLIEEDDLKYLAELRRKAIELQSLNQQECSLRSQAKQQHNQGQYQTPEQSEWHDLVTKIGELNTWFAKKIDNLHKI